MRLLEAIHTRAARQASYAGLLAAMVFSVLVSPVLIEAGLDKSWVLSLVMLVVLVGCLATAVAEARWFAILFVIVIVVEVAAGLVMQTVDRTSLVVNHSLRALVMLLTSYVLLRDLMRPGPVSADKVLGAICVFFLLAIFWAELYVVVEVLLPDSYSFPEDFAAITWDQNRHMLVSQYFSFVTLTTLGYGDVVPIRALARSLSMLQAVTGQFYIAIVVARLVSLYIMEQPQQASGADQPPSNSSSAS